MFTKIKAKFRNDPTLYYAMSIAATWAGVNSLMGGIEMAHSYGAIPFLIWAAGNILACIIFGVLAPKIPNLRTVFQSRPMKIIVGLLCVFQIWISLNGIETVFAETLLGSAFGQAVAYIVAISFLLILWKRGMIRNVLTDHASWIVVYALIIALCAVSFALKGATIVPLGTEQEGLITGLEKCVLLIPGAFLYPYFFEILNYNDENADGTSKIDIRKAFVGGGLLFGVYLIFVYALAFTSFGPITSILRAVLITLIAISSLSSFLYSVYISFGKKLGVCINAVSIAAWQLLIPMGVMGVWTLMSTIRIFIVIAAVLVAVVWNAASRRKTDSDRRFIKQ